MKLTLFRGLVASAVLVASAAPVAARTITVQMKNRGADGFMVFEPAFVKADPGDVIRFVPTDAGHNAETIADMLPPGATPVTGAMGAPVDVKVTKPGLYGIKCKPHYMMGMVALIKVGAGTAPNAAAAKSFKLPPMAAKRLAPYLAAEK